MLVLTAVQAWFKSSSLPSYLKQKIHCIALYLIPVALKWQDVLRLAWEETLRGCTKGTFTTITQYFPCVVNSQYFLKYPMETTKNTKQKQHWKTWMITQLREILDSFYLIWKYMTQFYSWCSKFTIVIYTAISYILEYSQDGHFIVENL